MRAKSFNRGLIWLWTQESFPSMAFSTDKAKHSPCFSWLLQEQWKSYFWLQLEQNIIFRIETKGHESQKEPFHLPNPENTRESLCGLWLFHDTITIFNFLALLKVLCLPDFEQFNQSTSVYMFKVFSNQISFAAMGKSWDLSFHFLEKQMSIARSRTPYSDNREEKKHLLSVISKPPSTSKFNERLYPITFPFKIN